MTLIRRLTTVAAALAVTAATIAAAAPVRISNDAGRAGLVDVYVDGQRVARNLFPGTYTHFDVEIEPGEREVLIVNPLLGNAKVFSGRIKVDSNGYHTLSFQQDGDHKYKLKMTDRR